MHVYEVRPRNECNRLGDARQPLTQRRGPRFRYGWQHDRNARAHGRFQWAAMPGGFPFTHLSAESLAGECLF